MKTTIAIIGTGPVGKALATQLANAGNRVLLYARDVAKASTAANDIKAANPQADLEAIDCSFNACWEADLIMVAIPYAAQAELARYIKEVATQKIVISLANETKAAEELQSLLPHSKIVSVFSKAYGSSLANPIAESAGEPCFIVGNDSGAVAMVSQLVQAIDLRPVVAETLAIF